MLRCRLEKHTLYTVYSLSLLFVPPVQKSAITGICPLLFATSDFLELHCSSLPVVAVLVPVGVKLIIRESAIDISVASPPSFSKVRNAFPCRAKRIFPMTYAAGIWGRSDPISSNNNAVFTLRLKLCSVHRFAKHIENHGQR